MVRTGKRVGREEWGRSVGVHFGGGVATYALLRLRRSAPSERRSSCEATQNSMPSWMRTISRISSGYAELYRGNLGEALQCFSQVRDPRITPKLHLALALAIARSARNDRKPGCRLAILRMLTARRMMFWHPLSSAADPNMRALAWEMKSRVARAENDFDGARVCHRSCPGYPRQVRHSCGGVASPSHCLGFVRGRRGSWKGRRTSRTRQRADYENRRFLR